MDQSTAAVALIENRVFDEIGVGDSASITRIINSRILNCSRS